ncbi:hypothetical protein DEU56DRAFT_983395 [Suillus clintonianus]|uniref:uncharacterized protein n=1 Tax=Suillus clintonianus TaxID=1904413 RepID=UPI001B86B856|nr:uncharacterized protein DEU56DRAFT_983395 [Suillus clintonianus]KAG2125036.1 hypothetical protein DEU56DRAFT_983395 [Suillus clintonianus]
MHRLFFVPELLIIICEQLYDEDDLPNASKEALARLSRTCKAFHVVALNALWSNLDGVAPLVQCLPAEVTRFYWDLPLGTAKVGIARTPQKAEWDIIQGYARRVQHLRVSNPRRFVELSVIFTLSRPPTTSPLFPNLRLLVWNDNRPQTMGFLRTLCGPLLTSLTFDCSTARWDIVAFARLISVPAICPAVKVVALPSSTRYPKIPDMLLAWSHLEEVTCGEIDADIFCHLVKQTCLRKLAFKLSQSISQSLTDSPPFPQAFSRVRELEVHAPDLSSLIEFMQKLQIRPTSVRAQVHAGPTPSDMRAFIAFFTEHYVGVKLQNVSLKSLPCKRMPSLAQPPPLPVDGRSYHTGIHGNDLMPLTQFGSIDTLTIDVNCSIHLADEDLASFASAWPRLRTFSINKTHGWVLKSDITQIGLLEMLQRCPELQTLCIAINTDTFTEVPLERPGGGIQNRNIRTLAFADSAIQPHATTVVAAFLSDVFPRLNEVTAWKSDQMRTRRDANGVDPSTAYAIRWEGVSQNAKGMIRIRQQERRWR